MKPKLLIPIFLALSIALVIVSYVSADTTAEILYPTNVEGSACIGSNAVYDFKITNDGSIATVFSISYTSLWPNTGPTFTPQLDVGEFYDFQVSVYIPWTAEPGDFDTLTLSVIGGGFSESATVTTTASFLNDWVDGANTSSRCPMVFGSILWWTTCIKSVGIMREHRNGWIFIIPVPTSGPRAPTCQALDFGSIVKPSQEKFIVAVDLRTAPRPHYLFMILLPTHGQPAQSFHMEFIVMPVPP